MAKNATKALRRKVPLINTPNKIGYCFKALTYETASFILGIFKIWHSEKGSLGLIHYFVKDSQVIIMVSYKGLRDEEIGLVEKGPLYAVAFDYI